VKIKFNDFSVLKRESGTKELNMELFEKLRHKILQVKNIPIRLLGIGVGFIGAEQNTSQLSFGFDGLKDGEF